MHGTYADAKVLNPHLTTDVPSSEIYSRVYEALLESDPSTGAAKPLLAETWTISPDGLTYTFSLRKDVKWHDGKPFTAHDVKATVEAILDPKTDSPRKSLFDQVKGAKDRADKTKNVTTTAGVTVVDDSTIKFELAEPYCPFLVSSMTALWVLPKHLYEGTEVNTNEYNKKPVG
ncbi:MAG: ABC transporter substrate-binding protein, partial [Anaerolineales bacterium]|nr:ABC transporter substrate-binding protein [Anaerolineales bacterium]